MFKRILSAFLVCALIAAASQVSAGGIGRADSVDEAVALISAKLEKQRFEIVGVIDHAAAAASVGLDLLPTQVVLFSKRSLDAALIRRTATMGIDLPQKVLVWEAADGSINLKYNEPGYLFDRHDGRVFDLLYRTVDKVTGQFGPLDNGLVSIRSRQSVDATVDKLRQVLGNAGFNIPFVIDHPAKRPMTLMIFGNPAVGTQLMQNSRPVALDLPQKFLVYEDRRGRVHILWNDPFFVAQRGGVQGLDTLLGNVANALRNFAEQGAQP